MNRTNYFTYCEKQLTLLCLRIETRGKLNILDFNSHCEDFYLGFFNLLYGYTLINMNAINQNVEAIDLFDSAAGVVVQVSATATKAKIESALTKDLSAYTGNNFKFISISKDAAALRKLQYKNPHSLIFTPDTDIHDVTSVLGHIMHLQIEQQKLVFEFIKKELGSESDDFKIESNLAAVIGILAKEDLAKPEVSSIPVAFNVDEKLAFNNLSVAASVVEDYKIHHGRVTKIYSEFDKLGQNKSKSILDALRSDYLRLSAKYSADELFFQVVDTAMDRVKKSANYTPISTEELELCVSVIAVDAFIRCKIFKNPEVAQNAAA